MLLNVITLALGALNIVIYTRNKSPLNLFAGIFALAVGAILLLK